MLTHAVRMSVAVIAILLCTFLPFLPGRHDVMAVPLAITAQFLGIVGLLFVPLGIVWTISEYRARRSADASPAPALRRRRFGIATLVVAVLMGILVSVGALAGGGFALGLTVLALTVLSILRLARLLRAPANEMTPSVGAIPLYMVVVPMTVFLVQVALADPLTNFSRNRAMQHSAQLIADIEQYRSTRGQYPRSLVSLWNDYRPSIAGISGYRYEPSGDAYNLYFEQFVFRIGTREIVMYNPLDQQEMTSHDMDLLEYGPAELALRRGYYAAGAASRPHWKYFWFD